MSAVLSLASVPSFLSVVIDNCTFLDEPVQWEHIANRNNVQSMNFEYCNWVGWCVLFPNLTKVSLSGIDAEKVDVLVQHCVNVRILELEVNEGTVTDACVDSMCRTWRFISELSFYWGGVRERQIRKLVTSCPSLTSLFVTTFTSVHYTTSYPPNYTSHRLHTAYIDCDDGETIRTLILHCPYLHALSLRSTGGESTVGEALSCIPGSSVKCLGLDYEDLCDGDILLLQHARLTQLCIGGASQLIIQLVTTLPLLHTLKLECCRDVDSARLLHVPSLCPTLRVFEF